MAPGQAAAGASSRPRAGAQRDRGRPNRGVSCSSRIFLPPLGQDARRPGRSGCPIPAWHDEALSRARAIGPTARTTAEKARGHGARALDTPPTRRAHADALKSDAPTRRATRRRAGRRADAPGDAPTVGERRLFDDALVPAPRPSISGCTSPRPDRRACGRKRPTIRSPPIAVPDALSLLPGAVFHERYRVVRCIKAAAWARSTRSSTSSTEQPPRAQGDAPRRGRRPDLRARFELEATVTGDIESDHIVRVSDAGRRRGHRHALPGDGAAPRRGPRRRLDAPRRARAGRGGDLPRAGGAGARQDARGRHRPPRPQAREPLPHPARRRLALRQGARLRHRQGRRARRTRPGTRRTLGTPLYMAPEQIRGDGRPSGRAPTSTRSAHIAYTLLVGRGRTGTRRAAGRRRCSRSSRAWCRACPSPRRPGPRGAHGRDAGRGLRRAGSSAGRRGAPRGSLRERGGRGDGARRRARRRDASGPLARGASLVPRIPTTGTSHRALRATTPEGATTLADPGRRGGDTTIAVHEPRHRVRFRVESHRDGRLAGGAGRRAHAGAGQQPENRPAGGTGPAPADAPAPRVARRGRRRGGDCLGRAAQPGAAHRDRGVTRGPRRAAG